MQLAHCQLRPATRRCSATRSAPTRPASAPPMAAGRCRPATRSSSTRPGGRRSAPWSPSLRHGQPRPTSAPSASAWPPPPPAACPTGSRPSPSATSPQDGQPELIVSFRRPFQRTYINTTRPRRAWTDRHGLSAHLGLYRPGDLSEIWVAGTLVRPVTAVAACDGALAVAYGTLDGRRTLATSAWRWVVFGFLPVEPLPGPGVPTCVDIDGDGRTEPAIMERSAR